MRDLLLIYENEKAWMSIPEEQQGAIFGEYMGLRLLDRPDLRARVGGFLPYHAARADLLRRLERRDEAAEAYRRALECGPNEAQRRYLARRLRS